MYLVSLLKCKHNVCWLDEEPAHDPDKSIAAADVVPEVGDGKSDELDVYVTEPSFSVGKSPSNGVAALEKTVSAGGLGEGTPKVSSFSLK